MKYFNKTEVLEEYIYYDIKFMEEGHQMEETLLTASMNVGLLGTLSRLKVHRNLAFRSASLQPMVTLFYS